MSKHDIKFLREKSNDQCRQLAGHYYRRARNAEDERDAYRREVFKLKEEIQRIKSYAYSIIEGDE
jgi:hypothetical protein